MFLKALRSLAARSMLVTLVLAGALCGLLAVLFHRYVELARDLLIAPALGVTGPGHIVLVLAVPTLTFSALAWLIRRFAPRAVGANLARVRMAYHENPKLLGARTIVTTFVATPLSLGAGAPLGPEGPIVVVASGVSTGLARLLRLPKKVVRAMIPIGVASGIAAIFNTPITGVVFAMEEVLGTSERGILGGVLVGAVAAAVIERMLLGGRALLAVPFSTWTDPRELIGFALVGIAAGLTSGLAIRVAHQLKRRWAAVMPSIVVRAAVAGLAIGAAGLAAPQVLGVGYESVSFWLHGGGSASQTAFAFAVKLVAFVIAISGGIIGGTFAPSLFLGSALGAAIGHGAHDLFPSIPIDPKAYAVLGMGSFFAGLLRSPIAAVLIVVELTRDYELIVPLMLGVSLAVSVSRRISKLSMVEQQMIDEGYIEERSTGDPLARVRVARDDDGDRDHRPRRDVRRGGAAHQRHALRVLPDRRRRRAAGGDRVVEGHRRRRARGPNRRGGARGGRGAEARGHRGRPADRRRPADADARRRPLPGNRLAHDPPRGRLPQPLRHPPHAHAPRRAHERRIIRHLRLTKRAASQIRPDRIGKWPPVG
jgi:CIC family chloride channel protein